MRGGEGRPALRHAVAVLAGALAFGMIAALIKGDRYGLRDTIGNLSTPWLLVAFLPALHTRDPRRGAVTGLAATLTALLGFYLVVAVTTDDQMPTLQTHLEHVLRKNRLWLMAGVFSGPVMGVLGALVRGSAADVWRAALRITGLLLVLEPVVIVAARVIPGWREVIHWTLDPAPYVVEAVLGVIVLVATLPARRGGPARLSGRKQSARDPLS
ncbi:DUF6518 family protein [Actinoplanes missouriensis]|uniref:DUF6518 family protein n=1 Tax=Actinoplanes missouriensis TaxID=1866 RepID=UPI0033D02405